MTAVKQLKAIAGLTLLAVLTSCTGGTALHSHNLEGWTVVMGDTATISRLCEGQGASYKAVGCALMEKKVIYCPEWDFYVCGHELHHATHGRWHK